MIIYDGIKYGDSIWSAVGVVMIMAVWVMMGILGLL